MTEFKGTYYAVQGLLAVNPNHPKWTVVSKSAVEGWEQCTDMMEGFKYDRFWNDVLCWEKKQIAITEFCKLILRPQKYQLRLLEISVHQKETEIVRSYS